MWLVPRQPHRLPRWSRGPSGCGEALSAWGGKAACVPLAAGAPMAARGSAQHLVERPWDGIPVTSLLAGAL